MSNVLLSPISLTIFRFLGGDTGSCPNPLLLKPPYLRSGISIGKFSGNSFWVRANGGIINKRGRCMRLCKMARFCACLRVSARFCAFFSYQNGPPKKKKGELRRNLQKCAKSAFMQKYPFSYTPFSVSPIIQKNKKKLGIGR